MKTAQFLTKIQGYYNMKYVKGIQLNLIATYINGKPDHYLDCLFTAVTTSFTGEYKMLPNIAVFEKLTDATYEIIDEQKQKQQIQDLKTPAITDGDEVDYSDEMKALFDGMDERFKKEEKKPLLKPGEFVNDSEKPK